MESLANYFLLFVCLFGIIDFKCVVVASRVPPESSTPTTTLTVSSSSSSSPITSPKSSSNDVLPTASPRGSPTDSSTTWPAAGETTTGEFDPFSETNPSDIEDRLEQSKFFRIRLLKQHMLASLGWTAPPQIDPEKKKELLENLKNPVYVMKQKFCYHPVCDLPMVELPDYINRSLWFDTTSKNIRFFFQIPSSDDPNLDITSAYVKLHLKRREDCLCAFGDDHITSRIHIKIYQYRKPIRSHARLRHSNMRLIDAKMVTWDSSRWVTLQVTDAIRRIVSRGRRNGGFEVHIRDMEENVLDAKTIIDPTVCTSTLEYECNQAEALDKDGAMEDTEDDPDYSPVLEVSSTTTSRIVFAYP